MLNSSASDDKTMKKSKLIKWLKIFGVLVLVLVTLRLIPVAFKKPSEPTKQVSKETYPEDAPYKFDIRIDDPKGDWIAIQASKKNSDPYKVDFADIKQIAFGSDETNFYLKFKFEGAMPKRNEWPKFGDGDNLVEIYYTMLLDTDNDKTTGMSRPPVDMGVDAGISAFFSPKMDQVDSFIETGPQQETASFKNKEKLSIVSGGAGYDYFIASFPLNKLEFTKGKLLASNVLTQVQSEKYAEGASGDLLDNEGFKFRMGDKMVYREPKSALIVQAVTANKAKEKAALLAINSKDKDTTKKKTTISGESSTSGGTAANNETSTSSNSVSESSGGSSASSSSSTSSSSTTNSSTTTTTKANGEVIVYDGDELPENPSASSTPPSPVEDLGDINPKPVIKHWGLEFGKWDPANPLTRIGAFSYPTDPIAAPLWEFAEGGTMWWGKELGWEWHVPSDAKIYAMVDGTIDDVVYREDTHDYSFNILINSHTAWMVGFDHTNNLKIKKGDVVTAGQELGTVGKWSDPGMGRTEFVISARTGHAEITDYCPTMFLDSSLRSSMEQQMKDFMSGWELYKGNDQIYQTEENKWIGCTRETTIEPKVCAVQEGC